jgi:hypothetical protein
MMRNWLSLLAAISAAASVAPVARAAPPAHVEIAYEVLHNGSPIAQIVSRLKHDDKTYEVSETWRGRGIFYLLGEARRSSRGEVTAEGLRPIEFTDKRPGRDIMRALFDWRTGTLTLENKGKTSSRPIPEHAHDRLSSFFDSAFSPPGAQPITQNVTDGRGVSTYVYLNAGRERVKTPAGEFDAVKLVKQKDSPDDREGEIWLAERLGGLPVRVLVTDKDGTRVDQVATRIAMSP